MTAEDNDPIERKNTTVTVLIRLQNDENNHSPVLGESFYVGSVSEGAGNGTVILNLTATDDDFAVNVIAGTISVFDLVGDPNIIQYFRTVLYSPDPSDPSVSRGAIVLA